MTFGGVGLSELIVLWAVGSIIVIPFWRILRKAGFQPWLSFAMLFPPTGIGLLFVLAFIEWPVEREIDQLRKP